MVRKMDLMKDTTRMVSYILKVLIKKENLMDLLNTIRMVSCLRNKLTKMV